MMICTYVYAYTYKDNLLNTSLSQTILQCGHHDKELVAQLDKIGGDKNSITAMVPLPTC